MKKIIILAFIFRLILAFLGNHPDVYDQLHWGRDLYSNGLVGFYDRDVPDAGPANYPPLYFTIVYVHKNLYELSKTILWNINLYVKYFPSNFFSWFESDSGEIYFNKLLPIAGDFGLAYFLYKIVKKLKNRTSAKQIVSIFLLFTPSWYISALWGQTDSLYLALLIGAIYFLICKKIKPSFNLYILSLLIKPLGILIAPVYFFYIVKHNKIISIINILIYGVFFAVIFYIPFHNNIHFADIFNLYFVKTREISGYISANAFNIWGMTHGFGPVADSKLLYGLPIFFWGIIIFTGFLIGLLKKVKDTVSEKQLIMLLFVSSLSAFMFLTRMHERYFYLPFIFLIISTLVNNKLKPIFIFFNTLFFINLYHYWWMPYIESLKILLSTRFVEFIICLIFVILYIRAFRLVKKII